MGLDPAACAQAVREAASIWAHPLLVRSRQSPRIMREWPLAWTEGGELLEGVVDLAFVEDHGLVLVDFKTDAITPDTAPAQAAHHAPQLRLYARGLERATGLPVKERVVLFTAVGLALAV
jgi:ATP-dependent helicase/nuclease subunit A